MKTKNKRFPRIVSLSAALVASMSSLHAADFTWGGGNLNWTDISAAGWNGGPPAATDTAAINSGTVTVTAAIDAAPITIAAGGKLVIDYASAVVANAITLNGTTAGGAIYNADRPGGNVNTLTGQITLNATSNIASWWNDKSLAMSGKITGPGGLILDVNGGFQVGGRFVISGSTNDYTGGTTANGRAAGDQFGYPAQAQVVLGTNNALPSGSALTLNTGTLILNGFSQTLSALSSTGVSYVYGGSTTASSLILNVPDSSTTIYAGNLGGSVSNANNFSLTKSGAGNLGLTGTTSHIGGTTVSAGILSLGNGTSSVNLSDIAALTIAADAVVDLNYTGTDVVGSLVINGTTVPSGTYGGTPATPLPFRDYFTGTGSITVATPLTGHVWGGGEHVWENTSATGWTIGTIPTIGDIANIPVGRVDVNQPIDPATVNILPGGRFVISYAGAFIENDFILNGLSNGGAIISNDGPPDGNVNTITGQITLNFTSNISSWWNNKTLELSGKITGNGGLVVDRASSVSWADPVGSRLLISGSTNDYTGGTTVNGRTAGGHGGTPAQSYLVLGANNALPSGSTLALNTGALYLNGFTQTLSEITSTGVSYIRGGSATSGTLIWDVATSNTFEGTLGGPGANDNNFNLTKTGPGTLTLTAANSFSGNTTVSAGSLSVGNGTTNGNLPDGGTVTLAAGTTVNLNHPDTDLIGGLVINGITVPAGTYNASNATHGSYFTGAGSVAILPAISGMVWGGGELSWEDLTASGWNSASLPTDTDTVYITSGRVIVTQPIAPSAIDIRTGGRFQINYNGAIIESNFTLNGLSSGGAIINGADTSENNVNNITGQITLNFTSNISSWWNDKTLELSGKITGNGGLVLDRSTSISWGDPVGGRFLISGTTNDYLGSTTVNGRAAGSQFGYPAQSRLFLGADNALPVGTALNLNTGALYLNGFAQTVSAITSTGVSQIRGGSPTAGSLTVNMAASSSFDGILGGSGANENNFSFTKSGAGILTLTAPATYTGSTTVNAGGLDIPTGGGLRFLPAANGITNSIAGSSTATLNYLGTVNLDLSATVATAGNTWTLVNLSSFSGTLPVFNPEAVASTLGAFTEVTPGIWELPATDAKWVLSETFGTLAYTSTLVANNYTAWATTNGITGTITDDQDNDGVANLIEYALADGGERGSFDAATRTVSFTKRAAPFGADVTVAIEESDDLGVTDAWEVVTATVTGDTISYTLPTGKPKIFARLKVTVNP